MVTEKQAEIKGRVWGPAQALDKGEAGVCSPSGIWGKEPHLSLPAVDTSGLSAEFPSLWSCNPLAASEPLRWSLRALVISAFIKETPRELPCLFYHVRTQ